MGLRKKKKKGLAKYIKELEELLVKIVPEAKNDPEAFLEEYLVYLGIIDKNSLERAKRGEHDLHNKSWINIPFNQARKIPEIIQEMYQKLNQLDEQITKIKNQIGEESEAMVELQKIRQSLKTKIDQLSQILLKAT